MMPSGGDHQLRSPSAEATLVELTSTQIEHVRPARSRWTALFIAVFTGLTCLGLTATSVLPRIIDRAADRGDPPSVIAQPASTTTGAKSPTPLAFARLSIGLEGPVVAIARVVADQEGAAVVRVTGLAAVSVGRIVVTLHLGGRPAGHEVVALDPDAAIPGTIGAAQVGVVHWAIDVPVPDRATPEHGDDRAIMEVSWGSSAAGPAGSDFVVVSLGDGRASG
jgi:hypothetical protein